MQVRLPDDLIDRIDNLRGDIPRETWIRISMMEYVEATEVQRRAQQARKRKKYPPSRKK